MSIIIGIDPGKTGGIASVDIEACTLNVEPMPVLAAGVNGKDVLDEDRVLQLISDPRVLHVFLEHAQAMPKNGAVSMFGYGLGFGQLMMAAKATGKPRTLVKPADWMKALDVKGKKDDNGDALFLRACELMPACRGQWVSLYKRSGKMLESRKDGLVDASLIAYYGCQRLGITLNRPLDPYACVMAQAA